MPQLLAPSLIPRFAGTVIDPYDDRYEDARRVYNGMVDRYPALIARCESVPDVAAALAYGRDNGLEIAVRAGAHSTPGFGTTDGGLVIDLGPLKGITVDPLRRIAWVQPGVVWSELDAATQEHGLAVTGGRVSSTGVAGFTLGSGSGWLERKMGLAADNLRAARVLTAGGVVVTASERENPDLFWALRGGGGNFGIVVEFEFALRPVGPEVLGGLLLWPRRRGHEVVRAYRDLMADAPDALCGGLALMSAPPLPGVPAELAGEPAVGVIVVYAGDPERGQEHLRGLRALAPAVDAVAPMPYCAVQSMFDGAHPTALRDYYKTGLLDDLTDGTIDVLVGQVPPSPLSAVLLQPLGGAFGRVGEMETALGNRDAAWAVQVLAQWTDAAGDEANRAWVAAAMDALAPRPAGFPNFIAETGEVAVAAAYGPERYARLVEAKRRWDPENVFRVNHNIRPE